MQADVSVIHVLELPNASDDFSGGVLAGGIFRRTNFGFLRPWRVVVVSRSRNG